MFLRLTFVLITGHIIAEISVNLHSLFGDLRSSSATFKSRNFHAICCLSLIFHKIFVCSRISRGKWRKISLRHNWVQTFPVRKIWIGRESFRCYAHSRHIKIEIELNLLTFNIFSDTQSCGATRWYSAFSKTIQRRRINRARNVMQAETLNALKWPHKLSLYFLATGKPKLSLKQLFRSSRSALHNTSVERATLTTASIENFLHFLNYAVCCR